MRFRALVFVGAALALPLTAGACGDEGDDVPATGGVVDVLESRGMERTTAECLGRAYETAGFTAEDLESVGADGIDPDSEKYRSFAEHAQACATSDISVPGSGS